MKAVIQRWYEQKWQVDNERKGLMIVYDNSHWTSKAARRLVNDAKEHPLVATGLVVSLIGLIIAFISLIINIF